MIERRPTHFADQFCVLCGKPNDDGHSHKADPYDFELLPDYYDVHPAELKLPPFRNRIYGPGRAGYTLSDPYVVIGGEEITIDPDSTKSAAAAHAEELARYHKSIHSVGIRCEAHEGGLWDYEEEAKYGPRMLRRGRRAKMFIEEPPRAKATILAGNMIEVYAEAGIEREDEVD